STVTVAVLLVVPVPPLVELTAPVVLFLAPAVVPFTVTLIVQLPPGPAGMVPLVRLTEVAAAAAVKYTPQLFTAAGVYATTNPLGRLSVNATPVSATALELFRVKVREVVPVCAIVAAPKALLIVGGETTVNGSVPLVLPPYATPLIVAAVNDAWTL